MTKNLNTSKTSENGEVRGVQTEVIKNHIVIQDIMALANKLDAEGKQKVFQSISNQDYLSKNVIKLLLRHADSDILSNLCKNGNISGASLESLLQKLVAIVQGTQQVPWILSEEAYQRWCDEQYELDHNQEDDNEKEDEDDEGGNNNENDEDLNDKEQAKGGPIMPQDVDEQLRDLLANQNLMVQQIEIMMDIMKGEHYFLYPGFCSHPKTPLWILEKAYERYPDDLKTLILCHPNVSKDLVEKAQKMIDQEEEQKGKADEIQNIQQQHPGLDIYQILQYYENKQDKEITQKIVEHICHEKSTAYYGFKDKYGKLEVKLALAKKHNLGETCILSILYDMLGDNIVERGTLEIGEYDKENFETTYLSIAELEKKYEVKITQEEIKNICKEIIEEMMGDRETKIEEIENVYTLAESLKLELTDAHREKYIHILIDAIEKPGIHGMSKNEQVKARHYFQKSLQLILKYKHLFDNDFLESYVVDMDQRLSLPLDVYILDDKEHCYWSNVLETARQDGFKDIRSLEGMDVFALIEKLGLSEKTKHAIALKKFKGCLRYSHDQGKEYIQKGNISRAEIVDCIINRQRLDDQGNETGSFGRAFFVEGTYSLEECLSQYGISADEVIPSFMQEIKEELVSNIKRKEYKDAQTIIRKYGTYISFHPDFKEHIETLRVLTNQQ